jgi:hypothetical protein
MASWISRVRLEVRMTIGGSFAGGLGQPDLDHLARIVPFVDGGRDVEPFIALQPDQLAAEGLGQDLRDLRLADAGFAFQKQRPAKAERQMQRGRERPVRDVTAVAQQNFGRVDGLGQGGCWHGCGLSFRRGPLTGGLGIGFPHDIGSGGGRSTASAGARDHEGA